MTGARVGGDSPDKSQVGLGHTSGETVTLVFVPSVVAQVISENDRLKLCSLAPGAVDGEFGGLNQNELCRLLGSQRFSWLLLRADNGVATSVAGSTADIVSGRGVVTHITDSL